MYMSHGSTWVEVLVSWKHTHESKCLMVAHTQKYMSRRSTCVEVHMLKVHNSHVITYLPSLLHYITPIFFWFISTTEVMHRLFSIAHIKTWLIFSGTQKFLWSCFVDQINVSHNKHKAILLFGARARGKQKQKWQVTTLRELWDALNNISLLLNSWTACVLHNACLLLIRILICNSHGLVYA